MDVEGVGAQEPGVVELKDGKLRLYVRTSLGYVYDSISGDGGQTWSELKKTELESPLSPLSCKRIPFGKHPLMAIWNNNGKNQDRTMAIIGKL